MKNEFIALEICANTEWLRENAGLDCSAVDENWHDEAADDFGAELHRRLTDAGFRTESARGQRGLFHGWNGANTFTHKLGPVATFDKLTADQAAQIERIIDAARTDTQNNWAAKYPAA